MNKVVWSLFELIPTPEAAVAVDTSLIADIIKPLGLQNKRAQGIRKFSSRFLDGDWLHVTSLPGIGKYAWVTLRMFYFQELLNLLCSEYALNFNLSVLYYYVPSLTRGYQSHV